MLKKILLSLLMVGFISANTPKVILITGTAYGIGRSTAEYLLNQGHIVYGGDILVEENLYLNDIGGVALEMDVTNQEHIDKAVQQIINDHGRIDVLVNNAGWGMWGTTEDVSLDEFKEQFETAARPPKYLDKFFISKIFSDINYLFNLL